METHTEFWTADGGGGLSHWRVTSHTAKTWQVIDEWGWKRMVRMADIGFRYHITPVAALSAQANDVRMEIEHLKGRIQSRRTALGMLESHMRRLGASVLIEEPESVDAVDPVGEKVTSGPRS